MTPKQEQFSQLVANGMSQSDAYRQAYNAQNMADNVIHVKASELSKNGKVTVRIKEIQAEIRDEMQISLKSQTVVLKELSEKAQQYDNPSGISAAIKAEMEINKLHGLIIDKQETRHVDPVDVVVTYVRPDNESSPA